jgi:hypothetical protein
MDQQIFKRSGLHAGLRLALPFFIGYWYGFFSPQRRDFGEIGGR